VLWFAEPDDRVRSSGPIGETSAGRVLIVDDERAIRLICRLNLRTAGIETLEADDGAAALALARSELPDLIVLDVMMPHVDGWEVAERLAENPETRRIPILFLTARAEPADEARARELGGVGYVKKPFDPVALTEQVAELLEKSAAASE
jgi:two-component system alkaline phosphatase synthesis response regulator PhoP